MAKLTDGLRQARENKADEFYTLLNEIEIELKHYKEYFKNKIILCNCDDPYESNFFKYFAINFNYFGLKKLISTCYNGSPFAFTQLSLFEEPDEVLSSNNNSRIAYKVEITSIEDLNNDGVIDLNDVELLLQQPNVVQKLSGNGDFRSKECIELLEAADIVVTNPPFSLFREFLSLLVLYKKQFIIIGNTNALAYKEMFSLFKEDKIRTGYTNFNTGMFFVVPEYYEKYHHLDEYGRKIARVSTSCWFTNLPVLRHKEELVLYKKYTPEEYPKYDNYDAINVSSYNEIPVDYDDVMGVPITFLDKFCPEQFELVGMGTGDTAKEIGVTRNYRGRTDLAITINGVSTCPYHRILIKKRVK